MSIQGIAPALILLRMALGVAVERRYQAPSLSTLHFRPGKQSKTGDTSETLSTFAATSPTAYSSSHHTTTVSYGDKDKDREQLFDAHSPPVSYASYRKWHFIYSWGGFHQVLLKVGEKQGQDDDIEMNSLGWMLVGSLKCTSTHIHSQSTVRILFYNINNTRCMYKKYNNALHFRPLVLFEPFSNSCSLQYENPINTDNGVKPNRQTHELYRHLIEFQPLADLPSEYCLRLKLLP
jgi:hypothetical protein